MAHLNADTTWLLQIPYPSTIDHPPHRTRFNILIDPWFKGPQSDVSSWFSAQWHAVKSSVQDIAELEAYLHEIESHVSDKSQEDGSETQPQDPLSYIDAVIISHEFTDHCHKATLLEMQSYVPVFATTAAANLIRSWKHFNTVIEVPLFEGSDWQHSSISPLPDWLGISRIVTPANALYYHAAISIFIASATSPSANAEAIIYTPHGIHAESVKDIAAASPKVSTLALLHGLHDVSMRFTTQLNLGAHNALKAQRILDAKYWVGTHDEVKRGSGIIVPLLKRKQISLEDALKAEDRPELKDVVFLELNSGESYVLL